MQPFIHQYWAPIYAKHYASFEDLKKNKPCLFSWEACSLLRREGHRNNIVTVVSVIMQTLESFMEVQKTRQHFLPEEVKSWVGS